MNKKARGGNRRFKAAPEGYPLNALFLIQQFLDQSLEYVTTCWSLSWSATECLPLWNWVAIGSGATGTLLLLGSIWKTINNSLKNRAARQEEATRQLSALEEKMKKPKQTGDAQIWDGVDRRTQQRRRKIAHKETMKKLSWMGHAELRGELDRRMSERHKSALDETNPKGMAYAKIRDELDRQEAPTIPPWASKK